MGVYHMLDDDAWLHVLEHMDEPATLLAFSSTCKRFRMYSQSWMEDCRRRFRVSLLEQASICLCGHHCSGSSSRRCCRCRSESGRRCVVCAEQVRLKRLLPSLQLMNELIAKERCQRWTAQATSEASDIEVTHHWHHLVCERLQQCAS
mmetsp:Transcript_2003/g.5094  ORF Transcript_2003/g.5094 Transcript_2003/m.5094 type:complete len:148 (-) Transcript_2003:214-657(-)